MKLKEIALGDLIETFDGKVGTVTDLGKKDICLSTFEDDIKIYCKDIKKIRYIKPMCLKHHIRYCQKCNQIHYQKSQKVSEVKK